MEPACITIAWCAQLASALSGMRLVLTSAHGRPAALISFDRKQGKLRSQNEESLDAGCRAAILS